MVAQTPDVSIAADGARQRASAAANQHVATTLGRTAPVPISATLCGPLHSRVLSVASYKWNALIRKETASHSAIGAQQRQKPPERHRRGGGNHQDGPRRPQNNHRRKQSHTWPKGQGSMRWRERQERRGDGRCGGRESGGRGCHNGAEHDTNNKVNTSTICNRNCNGCSDCHWI